MNKETLHFSRYLHWKKKGQNVVIFHELHPIPLHCSYRDWKKISVSLNKADTSFIRQLKQYKLIIKSKKDDDKEYIKAVQKLKTRLNQVSILYLILTWDCNFSCKYCPIPQNIKKWHNGNMSFETAKRGIDLWLQHLKNNSDKNLDYFIIFYGGEPFLNQETLIKTLSYIEELQKQKKLSKKHLHILIPTNGSLINKEIIKLLKKYEIEVVIAIDGPQKINDYYRKNKNDHGTFKQVGKALKLLHKNRIKTFASIAITPVNLNKISTYSLLCKKYHIEQFGFNILKGKTVLEIIPRKNLKKYYTKAATEIIKNFTLSKNPDLEARMRDQYKAFYNGVFPPLDCGGCGTQLVIQPNGDISNCPFLNYNLGNIKTVNKNFKIGGTKIVKIFRQRLPLWNKLYNNDEAKSFNGGGCPWNVKELKGNILAKDDFADIFAQKVLNFFLWSKFNKKYES
jgi:radical SAM protein with 4Fe4S-binding SPASM domain